MNPGRAVAVIIFLACLCPVAAQERALFREDFHDLSAWKEVFFPKISRHTVYRTERTGTSSALVADSDASASLLVYTRAFDVYGHPKARWRWKVSNVYAGADPRRKGGDDYPARIYVAFQYDPARAGVLDKALYNAARLVYGEYPPLRSLNYVWASRPDRERMIVSPYTDRSMMVLLQAGAARAGQWVDEEVDILADYRAAFGEDPPRLATIGIMSDSDNTGERATAYVDFIEVFR